MSIIGVLAGLLLPSLSTAKKRALSVACVNNLRQIGFAVHMYWGDNHENLAALSGIFPDWSSTTGPRAWTQQLFPYLKTTKVFLDPGRPQWMPAIPVHYYLNLLPAYVSAGSPGTGVYTLESKRVTKSSVFILMSEDLYFCPQQEIDPTNETSDRSGFSSDSTAYPPYHVGFANFLFADGHIAAFNHFDPGQMTYWYTAAGNWQKTPPPP